MDPYLKDLDERLKRLEDKFREEIGAVRSGRPSAEFVGNIKFMYYDQPTPVNQAASLAVVPPRTVQISAWDKAAIPGIAKAIEDAQAGFSVAVNGNVIHANLAALSTERRDELVKLAKKIMETFRIEVRAAREEALKKAKNAQDAGEITEDDLADTKDKVQKRVDAANTALEAGLQKKIGELAE